MILPDPHCRDSRQLPFPQGCMSLSSAQPLLTSAHELSESGMPFSAAQNPSSSGQLEDSFFHPAILHLPGKAGLLLSLHSQGMWQGCVLSLLFALHTSETHVCCLGYVISSFETQDVCPLIFLFLAVPNRGSLHTVCIQYHLLWEYGVRLEECFWEVSWAEEVKMYMTFSLNFVMW